MATVSLRHVTKSFGTVTAVNDLTLEVVDEEFLVLVGPSGCGKSTALRMVAGLEEVTAGEIAIDGQGVNHLPPKDRDVAMVFQSYALYPHMSAFDNMAFPLRMRNTPKEVMQRKVQEAADLLEVGHLLKRKPRELSGGERQRVALGRAIVREPKVFLMDEPLSNLDAKLRVQTRTEISRLHRRLRTTVIYVTHDQVEAMTMGTRIAVLRDGVLQQLDNPQSLYDTPANVFVAEFIGNPPMNVFPTQVVRDQGMSLVSGNMRLQASGPLTGVLGPYMGQTVLTGVRPEQIILHPGLENTAGMAGVFSAQVEVVEPLGSEQIVYLRTSEVSLVARVDPHLPAAVGDRVRVAVPAGALYCFDDRTQLALGRSGGGTE